MPMSEQNHVSPDNASGACPIVISNPECLNVLYVLSNSMYHFLQDLRKANSLKSQVDTYKKQVS